MKRVEYLTTINSSSGDGTCTSFGLSPRLFPFLKQFSHHFEMWKPVYINLVYKPSVGTTVGGSVLMGIDWNHRGIPKKRGDIAAYTPNCSTPVLKEALMTLPKAQLNSRPWFSLEDTMSLSSAPGRVWYSASGEKETAVGELWVEYHVLLAGTS